ncbi:MULTISPECIES: integrase family protein [unclassified Sinorhizobium]|uniref:tyrosine-type recombinase/integrase n=1 Tax=unclassified Sinorhizobium TaxID=2613772 RepID=UPI0024C3B223|nr:MULTISPECIES: integrase family protein [unclassified Sinorhizobium]MDK1376143.1 integrase family protein [Sinorhizobium sp. 6-70]MDK1480320.1 integrase family protein [Sinorhizobium sp. 6-117]
MKKLNAAALDTLPEGVHKDHIVPGLSLRVGKKRRTWTLRYVGAGGKQETDTIGHYVPNAPEGSTSMGLGTAREKAREILNRVEAGVPVTDETPPHPKQGGITFEDALDKYEKMRRKKGGRGLKTLDEALRTIRRNFADYLKLPLRDLTKADVRKVRDKVAKNAPQMSDRMLAYLSTPMDWFAKEDMISVNFIPAITRAGPGLVKRKHVLDDAELLAIWNACLKMESAEGKAYGRLVRFLMVVPARISEAAAIKHGTIIDGRWRQTEEDNKSAREHLLKLPQLALDQLGTGKAGEFAFPGKKGELGGISKFKVELDELCGVTGWRHHDLRRTITTTLQDMTDADDMPLFHRDVISACMNHAIEGADGHYLHGTMAKAKAKALAVWADKLDGILKAKAKKA